MKYLALCAALTLSACGTLPEPFYGNPGPQAARLAAPAAPVLMVPTPGQAMLDQKSAARFAAELAAKLAASDVPSVAGPAGPADWQLVTTASLNGTSVTPSYIVRGPDGKIYGTDTGAPVPAQGWANGDAATLDAAIDADTQAIVKTLASINAKIQQSSPDSLRNRVPRVYFAGMSGAPGDGDTSLPLNFTRDIPGPNVELVTDPAKADFTVIGLVKAKPDTKGQILVEIDWTVQDAGHRKIGQVTQLHDLQPSDIAPYWGDVAAAAAQEAAGGVTEVITNATLRKPAGG